MCMLKDYTASQLLEFYGKYFSMNQTTDIETNVVYYGDCLLQTNVFDLYIDVCLFWKVIYNFYFIIKNKIELDSINIVILVIDNYHESIIDQHF